MSEFISAVFKESWSLLLDSSVYMLLGILIAGLLKVFLDPSTVARHLGPGRFTSVIKAALIGVPLPLCSCGVLPAAVSLKKQGANKGAITAFLISTPESGIDSIAVSYALLDPIMTIVRPVVAFITAVIAGSLENLIHPPAHHNQKTAPSLIGPPMATNLPPTFGKQEGLLVKVIDGFRHALFDVWNDIAVWFLSGLLIAGLIMALIPDEFMTTWLNGGVTSMFVMLTVGIPLYICATASTPVAAALILKGVSPGAALVFLLVGPATNITSLSVLVGMLGKKSTIRYLLVLSCCAILFGLAVDELYRSLGISPGAVIGEASELVPQGIKIAGAVLLLTLSIKPLFCRIRKRLQPSGPQTYISSFPVFEKKDGK